MCVVPGIRFVLTGMKATWRDSDARSQNKVRTKILSHSKSKVLYDFTSYWTNQTFRHFQDWFSGTSGSFLTVCTSSSHLPLTLYRCSWYQCLLQLKRFLLLTEKSGKVVRSSRSAAEKPARRCSQRDGQPRAPDLTLLQDHESFLHRCRSASVRLPCNSTEVLF